MASIHKINIRYAKALFDVALEMQLLEDVYSDMVLLSEVSTNRELMSVLKDPMILINKKVSIITELFELKVTTLSLEFIIFVIRKRREVNLQGISTKFVSLYKTFKKVKTVHLQTVTKIGLLENNQLEQILKDFFKTDVNIEIEEEIKPELIGGFCIRFEDYLYDTSISTQLAKLRKEYAKNEYAK